MDYLKSIWTAIKPPWISGGGALGLALQLYVGALLLWAVIGNWLGIHAGTPSIAQTHRLLFAALTLAWGFAACVAAIGIYRNRWWAYFLELVVLGSVFCTFVIDRAGAQPTPSTRASTPIEEWLTWWPAFESFAMLLGFFALMVSLLQSGIKRYKETCLVRDRGTGQSGM